MKKLDGLKSMAENAGLAFATWSPGDGVTLYRFYEATPTGKEIPDYFSDDGIFTALGRKEAELFIHAYFLGLTRGGKSWAPGDGVTRYRF